MCNTRPRISYQLTEHLSQPCIWLVAGATTGSLCNRVLTKLALTRVRYGGIVAARTFKAAVTFDRLVRFMLREEDPPVPRGMLTLSILAVVMRAFVARMHE